MLHGYTKEETNFYCGFVSYFLIKAEERNSFCVHVPN